MACCAIVFIVLWYPIGFHNVIRKRSKKRAQKSPHEAGFSVERWNRAYIMLPIIK